MANEFVKAFKGIDKAIRQGTTRALNRALSNTKTQLVKNLGEDTSLKASVIKDRVLDIKATQNKQSVQLAVAVKVGVALSEFSPSPKYVSVTPRGRTHPQRFRGVSVRVAGTREIVPGAFLWTSPAGKDLVLMHKSPNDKRTPIVTPRSNVFKEAASARVDATTQFLQDKFNALVADQIDFAIQSKFDSD